jgi:hypothetical protein
MSFNNPTIAGAVPARCSNQCLLTLFASSVAAHQIKQMYHPLDKQHSLDLLSADVATVHCWMHTSVSTISP